MAISTKIIRGEYISKQECFDNAEEVSRTLSNYGKAVKAMDENQCICGWDWERIHNPDCPVHGS